MGNYIKVEDLAKNLIASGKIQHVKQTQLYNFNYSHVNLPVYAVKDLWVNLDCQRDITDKRASMIQNIAKKFDPYSFGMPRVTQTTCGKLVIPDGQGRTIASYLAGIMDVPCQLMLKINQNQSDDDFQGELFLTQGENTQAIEKWQEHRVALNIKVPIGKGTMTKCNRAKDIQRTLDQLNKKYQAKYGLFSYDGTGSVDFGDSYQYFSSGVFRDVFNYQVNSQKAGSRTAPELIEACRVYAEYCSEQKVEGQNLEVMNYFIRREAENIFSNSLKVNNPTSYNQAIDLACKQLRYILYVKCQNGAKQKLSNLDLKQFFDTKNCANKQVSTTGHQSLNSEWNKIMKTQILMQAYQQFV